MMGLLAKLGLKLLGVGHFLKGVSPKAWLAIAIAAALAVGFVWHQRTAHKALRQADATGYDRAKEEDRKAMEKVHQHALELRQKAETLHAKIASNIREEHDAQIRRNDALAADLLRRGPGKASCGQLDYPRLPAASGRPQRSVAKPSGPAVAGVPDPRGIGFIALPFSTTVAVARQCDADAAEVRAWRGWYSKQSKAWPTH